MNKKWLYMMAGLILIGGISILVYYIVPSQQEQIAAIRSTSKTFLVITRDIFTDALKPWKERRQRQGYDVIIKSFSVSPSSNDIKQWIKQTNKRSGGPCRYIMLVGDSGGPDEVNAPWHIPVIVGGMGYKYEEDEDARPYVSDAPYGDLDNDGQMEVAVGRLPVHTPSELAVQINKIVQHEERILKPSFYRSVLWTGGKNYHSAMHAITLQFIRNMLPEWLYPYFISSQPGSVCSGLPEEQPEEFLKAISEPAFISMVVGHGDYNNLRCVEKNGEEIPLVVGQIQGLESDTAVGPLILIACDAGSYHLPTEKGPSMAEAFLMHAGGPVAVIGAAGYINVVTNFYLTGSIANHIKGDNVTIGDLLVDSRQILYKVGKYTLKQIREYDTRTHRLIGPPSEKDMDLYTRKHLIRDEGLLYNLLGDPSLVFNKPAPFQVDVRQLGANQFQLSGILPQGAEKIWVQHYDINHFDDRVSMGATNDQMRRRFQDANQPPELLAHLIPEGDSWQLILNMGPAQMHFGNKIRVMAIGNNKAFSQTLQMPLRDTNVSKVNTK